MAKPALTLETFAVPRATKGEARSAVPPAPDEPPAGEGRGLGSNEEASRSQPQTAHLALTAVLEQMAPLEVETRTTVSVRLTTTLQERIRVMAFQTRLNKQEIIEQAIDAYLRAHGR